MNSNGVFITVIAYCAVGAVYANRLRTRFKAWLKDHEEGVPSEALDRMFYESPETASFVVTIFIILFSLVWPMTMLFEIKSPPFETFTEKKKKLSKKLDKIFLKSKKNEIDSIADQFVGSLKSSFTNADNMDAEDFKTINKQKGLPITECSGFDTCSHNKISAEQRRSISTCRIGIATEDSFIQFTDSCEITTFIKNGKRCYLTSMYDWWWFNSNDYI